MDDNVVRRRQYGGIRRSSARRVQNYDTNFDPDFEENGKDLLSESKNEAVKENIKEESLHQERFDELIHKSSTELFRAKTYSFMGLFPTELIIDIAKVNIIYREFFASARVQSITISDITDLYIDTSFFSATLKIVDYLNNNFEVGYLRKEDAAKARRIIQGLLVAGKNHIDLTRVEDKDIKRKIEQLGAVQVRRQY